MRDDINEAKKRYEKLQKQAEERLAENAAKGKSFENIIAKGTPVNPERSFVKDLAAQKQKLKETGGLIKNISSEKKIADAAAGNVGLLPELRNKSIIDALKKEASPLQGVAGEAVKGSKALAAFAPIMKALGIGSLGLSALGAGQKAMAGEPMEAAKDVADTASYALPVVGEARMLGDISMGQLGAEPTEPVSLKGSVFEDEYNNQANLKKNKRFDSLKNKLVE